MVTAQLDIVVVNMVGVVKVIITVQLVKVVN